MSKSAEAILERAAELGVTLTVAGDLLQVRPKSAAPPDFVDDLRENKPAIIDHIRRLQGYRREFPEDHLGDSELAELVRLVEEDGVCLVWAVVLGDFVAFYRFEADRAKIPVGFVPYSSTELLHLFGPDQPDISTSALRLVHAAKKEGARVTGSFTDNDQDLGVDGVNQD